MQTLANDDISISLSKRKPSTLATFVSRLLLPCSEPLYICIQNSYCCAWSHICVDNTYASPTVIQRQQTYIHIQIQADTYYLSVTDVTVCHWNSHSVVESFSLFPFDLCSLGYHCDIFAFKYLIWHSQQHASR